MESNDTNFNLINDSQEIMPDFKTNPFWAIFFKYLADILFYLGIFAAIIFILHPLLSKNFWKWIQKYKFTRNLFLWLKKFMDFLWYQISNFFNFLKYLFNSLINLLKSLIKISRKNKENKKRKLIDSSISKDNKYFISKKKKRQLIKMLRAFKKLVRWGKKQGIYYRISSGPIEYTNTLSTKIENAEKKKLLSFVSDLLEEELYSSHLIKKQIISIYFNNIKSIIKQK